MFTKNEHADILNTMVDDQFDQVLDALRHSTAMDVRWEPVPVPNSETGDGSLVLRHNASTSTSRSELPKSNATTRRVRDRLIQRHNALPAVDERLGGLPTIFGSSGKPRWAVPPH